MSNAFAIEENYRETNIRQGNPIGGYYETSGTGDWERLMPSKSDGAAITDTTVADYNEKLNIGALRSDITNAPIGGWLFFVLKPGYEEMYQIRSYASNIVHLARTHRQNTKITLHNIPGDIPFVIFPAVIAPFTIHSDMSPDLEIGLQPQDKWGDDDVHKLCEIKNNETLVLPNQRIDRLMYKAASGSNNVKFSWGEHIIYR